MWSYKLSAIIWWHFVFLLHFWDSASCQADTKHMGTLLICPLTVVLQWSIVRVLEMVPLLVYLQPYIPNNSGKGWKSVHAYLRRAIKELWDIVATWVTLFIIAVPTTGEMTAILCMVGSTLICSFTYAPISSSVQLRVILKNFPWGLDLLQVDGKNLFVYKKSLTVS